MSDAEQLQRDGATARAAGASRFDNPLFDPGLMPAATGEAVEAWSARAASWTVGWVVEDAIRGEPALYRTA